MTTISKVKEVKKQFIHNASSADFEGFLYELFFEAPGSAEQKYVANVFVGEIGFVYGFVCVDNHTQVLTLALEVHRQNGFDPKAVTEVVIYGMCKDVTCGCGGIPHWKKFPMADQTQQN